MTSDVMREEWNAFTRDESSYSILLARSIWRRRDSALMSTSILSIFRRCLSSTSNFSALLRSFRARWAWMVFGQFAARASLSALRVCLSCTLWESSEESAEQSAEQSAKQSAKHSAKHLSQSSQHSLSAQ